jgi:hypothetical protein
VTTCPVCLVSIFAHCIFPVHKIAMSMGGASISLGMLWAAAVGLLILLQTQHTIMHTISDISNQLATGQYAGWDTSGTAEKLGPKETASRIQSDIAKAGVRGQITTRALVQGSERTPQEKTMVQANRDNRKSRKR